MAVVADDLSKCSIKEVEKPAIDKTGGIPMTRLPLPAPQNIKGVMTNCSLYFAFSFPSFFPDLIYVQRQTLYSKSVCSLLRLFSFYSLAFYIPNKKYVSGCVNLFLLLSHDGELSVNG